MSEDTTTLVEAPKATLFIERSVSVRPYETLKAAMHFPVDLPLPALYADDPAAYYKELDDRLRAGFTTVKCHIFEQLGIEFEDKNGIMIEKVAAHFAGAVEVQNTTAAPQAAPPATAPVVGPVGKFGTCAKCGGTEFWDNTAKKAAGEYKANAPDAKCKNRSCANGVWLKG